MLLIDVHKAEVAAFKRRERQEVSDQASGEDDATGSDYGDLRHSGNFSWVCRTIGCFTHSLGASETVAHDLVDPHHEVIEHVLVDLVPHGVLLVVGPVPFFPQELYRAPGVLD